MKGTATQLGTKTALNLETFLLEVVDAVNTTLDPATLLRRVAELVQRAIPYEIFAILLLNEEKQELRMRFQIGHSPEAEKLRIKVGAGIVGTVAQRREALLVPDVTKFAGYINAHPRVRSELAIPLIIKNRVIGVLDLQSPTPGFFTPEHKRLLTVIGSRIAIAIENARLYTRVARQARNLGLLFDISRELTSILNVDELLQSIADRLAQLIDYQMFSILLLDESGQKLQHRFSLRFRENIQLKHDIPLERGLVGYAARHRKPVLVPDVSKDPRYIALNPETRSELCVPLIYKDQVIGVLDLEHTRRGFFTEDHMRTITTLAAQVAIAVENARLYERISFEEKRLERDLAMARELQFHLLPQAVPALAHAQLAARFAPARAIGGDLYDFIPYSRNRMAIAVGDVSGKGAPAAIYAALVNGFLRSHAAAEPCSDAMLANINTSLVGRPISAQFVSMIFAVWSDRSRKLQVANSGLPRPVFCRNGKPEIVQATGLPLGLFAEASYEALNYQAQPGDVFVFFSDGMLDAVNLEGELFGRKRIEQIVAAKSDHTADEIAEAVFSTVAEHAAGVETFDDQTIVVLKVQ